MTTPPRLDTSAAVALVGFAGYQIWSMYREAAPSLADLRSATPGDVSNRQRLLDADLSVGSLALILGVGIAILTRDMTAMLIMIVVLGTQSLWYHSILAAESR